jgi:oxygen-dependent protoporphyrinogen oxidase
LLSLFLGGTRKQELVDLSNEKIIELAANEVKAMMGLQEFNPDLLEISRYEHAIPQYGIESEEKLKAIQKAEEIFPGLILGGNIRDGIGMADRIKQGKEMASQIVEMKK